MAKETTNGKPGAGVNDFPFVTLEERKLWGQASLTPRVYAAERATGRKSSGYSSVGLLFYPSSIAAHSISRDSFMSFVL